MHFFNRHFLVSSKNNRCWIYKLLTASRQTESNLGIPCWYRNNLLDFRTFRFQIKFESRHICNVKLNTRKLSWKGGLFVKLWRFPRIFPHQTKKNSLNYTKAPFFLSFQHTLLKNTENCSLKFRARVFAKTWLHQKPKSVALSCLLKPADGLCPIDFFKASSITPWSVFIFGG